MVPCSTTHFSSPLFFQPVRSFPLKRETHPLCGGAFATAATPRNIAAARKAPILFTAKPPSLLLEESEGLVGRNLSQIQRRPRLFPPVPSVSATAWLISNPPVSLPGFQVADAQLRQVAGIALIDLLKRKIVVPHLVLPRFHVFGIV